MIAQSFTYLYLPVYLLHSIEVHLLYTLYAIANFFRPIVHL